MSATLQELLAMTRMVFAGTVSRAQLSQASTRVQVFVGTAIMLAAGQVYLDEDNTVKGSYSRTLEQLLSAGIANPYVGERGFKPGQTLVSAARNAGLYQASVGRGGVRPVVINPPVELVELVRELGSADPDPDPIAVFLQDSVAGVAQDRLWRAEYEQALKAKHGPRFDQDYMTRVIRETFERFGKGGVRALHARLEQWLSEN